MEPLTEHREINGPLVYGFLRLVGVSAARHTALAASLTAYCRGHELQLAAVFTDRESSGPDSAAFTGLLDVLALPDAYGVIAPAMSHLGPKTIAAERARRIRTAGSRLLLVRRPHTAHHTPASDALRFRPPPQTGNHPRPGHRAMRATMTETTQRFFTARPESIGQARTFATEVLSTWGLLGRVEDIRLCVSELATNALVHGAVTDHGFLVKLAADNDVVRLEVHDRLAKHPVARQAADTDASGRGLILVSVLADGWGVQDHAPFGKFVWSCFKAAGETAP
ncbi:ATP-binding protein [Streptomyces sp. NPDC050400]|uniref:ATP-binding protein n=1 Tax=Streptomyces sp. NPDC050400 TaxID=3365610 RepID=UPI0037B2B097